MAKTQKMTAKHAIMAKPTILIVLLRNVSSDNFLLPKKYVTLFRKGTLTGSLIFSGLPLAYD